jgi:signal recognition particle receptor subunit alpha
MDSIVVNKDDEDAHRINIEAEMEKYLGGDDEVLQGFYDSDEEIEFDSIGNGPAAAGSSGGFFSRITSAFQSIAGNKVLTREDMEPILRKFAQQLMDKNVAQDVADDICKQVQKSLMDQRT